MPSGGELLSRAQLAGCGGQLAHQLPSHPPWEDGEDLWGGTGNGTGWEGLEFWPKPDIENTAK